MLDKLIDTTLGGAGLCGENRLLLMDAPPADTARENKLSGCSAGRATPCQSPGSVLLWPLCGSYR